MKRFHEGSSKPAVAVRRPPIQYISSQGFPTEFHYGWRKLLTNKNICHLNAKCPRKWKKKTQV